MNNYDQSSTGDNINLSVSYDSDLAQMYFQDFVDGADGTPVERLQIGRDSTVFLVGNSSLPFYTKTALNLMKKTALIELDQIYEILCPYDYADTSRAELIAELKGVSIKRHYEYLLANYTWREFDAACPNEHYISRGYSQGDAIYIVNLNNGGCFNKKNIDHILWDLPISIYLTVNGDDELGNELLDDCYNYDKDAITEKVKKLDISENAKTWIVENLPNDPKHD